jgi:hypothetical protein
VLAGVDHYARALARRSDTVRAPGWAPVWQPAVARVRDNLDVLRSTGDRVRADAACDLPGTAEHRDRLGPQSAEELIDAAEAWAARWGAEQRDDLLEAARLLRRIDQSVLFLAGVPPTEQPAAAR